MSEQSALQNWIDEWTALRDHTRAMLARLEALTRDAPSPRDVADVRQLFTFRDAASLDGPASEGEIHDAAQQIARPFAEVARLAASAAKALLSAAEAALPRLAKEGAGVVSGTDLPQTAWFILGEANERRLIGARLRDLPPDHVLRGIVPEAECFMAGGTIPAVVMGPSVVTEGDRGYVHKPRRWYSAFEIPHWTRAAERRRVADAENQAAVSAVFEARRRADEEAAARNDPAKRLRAVETELSALRARGTAG